MKDLPFKMCSLSAFSILTFKLEQHVLVYLLSELNMISILDFKTYRSNAMHNLFH